MSVVASAASLTRLREDSQWKLLNADSAPCILAIFEAIFEQSDTAHPSTRFHEDVKAALEDLQQQGEPMTRTAREYVSAWLSAGWLVRSFPAGATEEEYALAASARSALQFVTGARTPRRTATASRLATVLQQATQLSDETDSNQARRLARLIAERDEIEREIANVERHEFRVLPDEMALDRARTLIQIAEGITADFHNVRDAFATLHRTIRHEAMLADSNRGAVLDQIFDGIDIMATTDAGRSFDAFWAIIGQSEQRDTLTDAVSAILSRPFAALLTREERRFLDDLTYTLLHESSQVLTARQAFTAGLRQFVESKEFRESRRMQALLRDAMGEAAAIADTVRLNERIAHQLVLTSAAIGSAAQWALHDPADHGTPDPMRVADTDAFDLAALERLFAQSDIDWALLRRTVAELLASGATYSLREILEAAPATHGLASVVGYLMLGMQHAHVVTGSNQTVSWITDGVPRHARVPMVLFSPDTREALLNG